MLKPRGVSRVFAFALCGAISGVSAQALAQTPPEQMGPYPTVAPADSALLLGGWLEQRFEPMVETCTDWDRRVRKGWRSVEVSVVPPQLSSLYLLERDPAAAATPSRITRVFDLGSQSLPALFANVRQDVPQNLEISADILPVGPGVKSLYFNDIPVDLRLANPHFRGAAYSATCANAVSYAYGVGGGFAVPQAAIKAALRGGGGSTQSNALRIIEGTFYSPFAAMWKGSYTDYALNNSTGSITRLRPDAVEPLKTHVGLIFWRWYLANPDLVNGDNGILEYFSGLAVAAENQQQTRDEVDVDGEFSANLPVLSASLKASASRRSRSDFWAKNYYVAAFRDGRSRHPGSSYMKVPKPAEIRDHFRRLRLFASPETETLTIYNKAPVLLGQYIYGVTEPSCATSNWEVVSVGGAPSPTLLQVGPSLKDEVPICLAEFSYTPTDADVANGAKLNFALNYATPVKSNGQDMVLQLAATPVTLKAAGRPDWGRLNLKAVGPVDPSNINVELGAAGAPQPAQIRWRVEYQFDPGRGSGQPIESSIRLINPEVRCTGGKPVTVITPTPTIETRPGLGRVLVINLDAGVPAGTAVTSPNGAPSCQFSAQASYKLQVAGSPEVDTKLEPVQILYPLPLLPPGA